MRLLVVTARYPTADRPSAGTFVRDRLADPTLQSTVISPRGYAGSRWAELVRMIVSAATQRGRYDGVEAHFVLPTGPIGLLAARLRRVPLVLYAHGTDVRAGARRSVMHRWLARRCLQSADAVVTNSTDTAAHVAQLGAAADIVPPGVDLHRFRPTPRPYQSRVLYLGGSAPDKGIDVARELADTLAGPGIREVQDVAALIAEHDVVLVPSSEEGYGMVAAEAIASGRWVVASSVGGLREVVVDGVTGTLVTEGDYARALAEVPDYEPEAVAANATSFGLERCWSGMAAVWDRVLGAHGSVSGATRAPPGKAD
jgi:glycosyltransferase involved in cell wall biosynthesis